jgi:hypothetical protein
MIHKSRIFLTLAGSFLVGFSSLATTVHKLPNEILTRSFFFSYATAYESDKTPDEENKFTLYINQGTLSIKYGNPIELVNGEVIVYNLLGQEITRKKLENSNLNQVTIPVQNTCYLVKISYSGKVHTQKVMISAD